jgi:Xaa-Pro aminopeptidase
LSGLIYDFLKQILFKNARIYEFDSHIRSKLMARLTARVFIAVLLLLQAAGSRSADNSFFAARREALMKKIDGGLAVLQGAPETRAYIAFRQSNDFYYLTGVEVPGAFVLIDAMRHRSVLFLPPRNRQLEIWEGPRLYAGEEARAATGFDGVMEVSRLGDELEKRKAGLKALYTPLKPEETASTSRDRAAQFEMAREHSSWDGRVSRGKAFEQSLKKKLGESVAIKDLSPFLDEMRRVKDALEIDRLRESSRIGAMGIKEAMRAARPGVYEYQLAAAAEFVFKWNGAMGPAYFPIVGSGPNSCALHYSLDNRKTEPGDIVVMDFGPDYQYYHSDITRTFPVSGKFSEEQAKVYQIVLEAQKAALQKVRPGNTFNDVGSAAREVVAHYGYLNKWLHGVSHYLGMSTHDVGSIQPLVPGVVITVEPGLYFPEKNLGVRIEDTVLVTKDGCEVLSQDVPKEIADVEKLMAEKSILPQR